MTRKQWTLIALAVLLGGVSLYLNQDWFAKENIQIVSRSRPGRGTMSRHGKRFTASEGIEPLFFSFDRNLRLTSLKVIAVSEIETNKYPRPVWSLVSDSNSVPVKDLAYGMPIYGMRPSVKGATAEPLEPGAKYRLFIEAGLRKAEHDFEPVAATP
jgi:hypothetical protein